MLDPGRDELVALIGADGGSTFEHAPLGNERRHVARKANDGSRVDAEKLPAKVPVRADIASVIEFSGTPSGRQCRKGFKEACPNDACGGPPSLSVSEVRSAGRIRSIDRHGRVERRIEIVVGCGSLIGGGAILLGFRLGFDDRRRRRLGPLAAFAVRSQIS